MADVLLIGLGSVGVRHLAAARTLGNQVVGVDPKPLQFLNDELSDIELHPDLRGLRGRRFEYCVIANWGPDHISTLREVYAMSLSSKFIIEKPLCGSFKDLRDLANLIDTGNFEFIISFPRRYLDFKRSVEEATDGAATSISVWGGAQCISTNGSHWLDVAIGLFGFPKSVIANLDTQQINPRSPDLDFFEGTASYQFSGGEKLDISFDNTSWVSLTTRVLFRNGILEIKKGTEFYVRRVDKAIIEGTPVTRTKSPGEEHLLSHVGSWDEAFLKMHLRIAHERVKEVDMRNDLKVGGWLLMALQSSSEGRRMLEKDFNWSMEESEGAWKIS